MPDRKPSAEKHARDTLLLVPFKESHPLACSPSAARQTVKNGLLSVCLILPWVNPFVYGPSVNVLPWLISAFCAVFICLLRRNLTAQHLALTWLVAALISSLMAALQYFGWGNGFNAVMSQTTPGEAFANLRQRNQLATLTSIGLVALIALVSRPDGSKSILSPDRAPEVTGPHSLLPASLCMGLLAIGNAASGSRTGLLQWALVLALSAAWAWRSGYRVPAVFALRALLTCLAVGFALPWLFYLVTGEHVTGQAGRLAKTMGGDARITLWSNVLTMIAEKPWLGWGWGELDYAHFITLFPGPRFYGVLNNAHNLPLHLAVELGLPVAAVVCATVIGAICWGKPCSAASAPRQMAWGVLAVIGLHSLLEFPLWYGPFQIATMASCALLWVTRHAPAEPGLLERQAWVAPGPSRPVMTVLASVAMAALVYASIDYFKISQIYLPSDLRHSALRDDTLDKVGGSWLFADQVQFSVLTKTRVDRANAAATYDLALKMLHYSPEPRVIERVIASAALSGHMEEAHAYRRRYQAAYPLEHGNWAIRNKALVNLMDAAKSQPSP